MCSADNEEARRRLLAVRINEHVRPIHRVGNIDIRAIPSVRPWRRLIERSNVMVDQASVDHPALYDAWGGPWHELGLAHA